MKIPLILAMLFMLAACADEPPAPPTAPTKAEIQKRDEFARNLPKPPEH